MVNDDLIIIALTHSELNAALLFSQLQHLDDVNAKRMLIWQTYFDKYKKTPFSIPHIPDDCLHNAHCFYLILPSAEYRHQFVKALAAQDIHVTLHYHPLHHSDFGRRFG